MDLQIGSTLGDYEIVSVLGMGGMGKVYKVRNTISDRVEAMKVLLPDLSNAPEQADRFLREIKVQASLVHPNIAALHTAVRQDNQLLMVMEFVDGITLEQRLKQGPIPVQQAVDYIMQVLSGLEYAHAHGVVHRDIKPANMMLTQAGTIKLMDFGIAKASSDSKLTMTGTTMGSLYYMSPEQIQGAANLDARSDLYSVGVSLYELVTGKRPFDGESQLAIMSAHLQKTPIPPISVDPDLPPVLNDVILMSVAKAADARLQSAKAFRNALSNAVSPSPVPMATAPRTAPVQAAESRRGLWMAIGGVAVVAALIAFVELAPHKGIKAANPFSSSPAASAAPATGPAIPVQAPAQTPPVPESRPAEKALDAVPPPPQPQPVERAAPAPVPVRRQPVAAAPAPGQQVQVQPQPQPQTAPAVAPPQAPAAPTPDPGPSRAEIQKVRVELSMLNNRASVVNTSMQNLQRSQASQGFNIGPQYTGPAGLMDTFLREAADSLNANDLAGAKDFAAKAERQIEILEKLFHL